MNDEHQGQGGTYIRDPETGERRLVERTEEQAPATPEPEKSTAKAPKAVEKGK